jgi:hypothetical protein
LNGKNTAGRVREQKQRGQPLTFDAGDREQENLLPVPGSALPVLGLRNSECGLKRAKTVAGFTLQVAR